MQSIGQFMGVVAVGRLVDEDVYGGEQGAMTRKPNALVRPESAIVEMGNFRQGVEAPAMRIAGEVAELLEFAKYGEIGFGAEGALQLGQIGDLVAALGSHTWTTLAIGSCGKCRSYANECIFIIA